MRDIVIAAGVQVTHYDVVIKPLDLMTTEQVSALLAFLEEFQQTAYQGVLNVWSLKTPEWWENMVMIFDQTENREAALLSLARRQLRAAWRKRNAAITAFLTAAVADAAQSLPL